MDLARSTFYDAPAERVDDAELVARMAAICDAFECYGYRRVGAALRQKGVLVNSKKVRRLMREHRKRLVWLSITHISGLRRAAACAE